MSRSAVLSLVLLGSPAWVAAQGLDSLSESRATIETPAPHVLRWWHGAAVAGALSTLMVLDHPVQRYARHNSGTGADNVASVVRHFGQPEAYVTVTLGMLATGLIAGRPDITRSGGRLALAMALAGAATEVGKVAVGRPRPEQSLDADGYEPFSGQVSMPSGHTAAAFALATSLADAIHNPVAAVGLYGLSTAVGWSRINDNRHWFTDVAAGALVGITSAKLASGRWRIFRLHPPSFIAGPQGAGLGWQASF
ncbi:MAG: phosphatase PAP2 family protein [Gemmatimonadales bacterium]